jgi:hypothetical protein
VTHLTIPELNVALTSAEEILARVIQRHTISTESENQNTSPYTKILDNEATVTYSIIMQLCYSPFLPWKNHSLIYKIQTAQR